MSEQTGSEILSGNPANSEESNNAPTIAATDSGSSIIDKSAPASDVWYKGIQDKDLQGYAEAKGWKSPEELAHSYKNLEKLLGSEKLPMPKDDADVEAWNKVYDRLGRPKTADDYGIKAPDGTPPEFAQAVSAKFHELGLTAKQATELSAWYQEQGAQANNAQVAQSGIQQEQDMMQLRRDWGAAYDANVEHGRRAVREYGITGEQLAGMEKSMGTGALLKLMAKIGTAQGEAPFNEGTTAGRSFNMTPSGAKAKLDALQADRGWQQKYLAGDSTAKEEMSRLMALAYPEE